MTQPETSHDSQPAGPEAAQDAKPAAAAAKAEGGKLTAYLTTHKRSLTIIAVAVLLAVHWFLAVSGVVAKSATSDEPVHLISGYAAWHFNDYRFNPENGNLPGRLSALPLVLDSYKIPAIDPKIWHGSDEYAAAQQLAAVSLSQWESILLRGRSTMALLSVALGLVVFFWSRSLFENIGGLLSLTLYALDPTILANGPLMTSDLCAALFFTLAVGAFWRVLDRVTPLRLLLSCLAIGGLFLSKMSAVLIVPMLLALVVIQLLSRRPLDIRLIGSKLINSRVGRGFVLLGILAAHAVATVVIIWAAMGFRYSAFSDGPAGNSLMMPWRATFEDGTPSKMLEAIEWTRHEQILPEAYLYGMAQVYQDSQERRAFLNGEYSTKGWWYFFPYSFGVKTPIPTLAAFALALAAGIVVLKSPPSGAQAAPQAQRLSQGLYRIAPLLVLLVVYWSFAIASHINIGHRHLLPVYPAMFILAGAIGYWVTARSRLMQYLVFAVIVLLINETRDIFPTYLAYFNQFVGGPTKAYEHMVDSSLDWGQDLPVLEHWLSHRPPSAMGEPVYLSWFGFETPESYGIRAVRLVSYVDPPDRPLLPELRGGIYCFSATMLETVLNCYFGQWNRGSEADYQMFRKKYEHASRTEKLSPQKLEELNRYDQLRFSRLAAYLRTQTPIASIGHSVLIFRLTDEQVDQALHGPPAQMGHLPTGLHGVPEELQGD